MRDRYCEYCHTSTGEHLPDCENAPVPDEPDDLPSIDASAMIPPYDHTQQQPALWGSAFAPDADGNKKPVAEAAVQIIHSKR